MAPEHISTYEEPNPDAAAAEVTNPVKRIRWATQRVTGRKASQKRQSVFTRHLSRGKADEKKRQSAATEPDSGGTGGDEEKGKAEQNDSRHVYFNEPLPTSARDEEGHPLQHFPRNKIRTAKYTPLSFVPKNLWLQFHNIANIYFLFIVILTVSITRSRSCACRARDLLTRYRSFPFSEAPIPDCLPFH